MSAQYSLELRNLSKIYGSGNTEVRAVDAVDLQVKPGEIVLVMGPSGSGKTTLLSMAGLAAAPHIRRRLDQRRAGHSVQ